MKNDNFCLGVSTRRQGAFAFKGGFTPLAAGPLRGTVFCPAILPFTPFYIVSAGQKNHRPLCSMPSRVGAVLCVPNAFITYYKQF